MVEEYSANIAYSCPRCGRFHKHELSVFDVGVNGVSLFCDDCDMEILKIKPARGKYFIEYMCPLCGAKHTASFMQKGFWNKDGLSLSCSQIGIDTVFFGKSETIDEMVDFENHSADELFPEEITCIYGVIKRLEELGMRGAISCGQCGARKMDLKLEEEGVRLICRSCGNSTVIVPDSDTLDRLMNLSDYVIE